MRVIKQLSLFIFIAVLSLGFLAAPASYASAAGGEVTKNGWCISADLPVAPAQGSARHWKVATKYCQPFTWANGPHQADVLTHGATYNSTLWDWPQNSPKYSYVQKTLAAGRATLSYDRIAAGHSTRPANSAEVTIDSEAYVLHQLISLMKYAGYKHVNSIGHSYGSGIALNEAATYGDVTNVVLTGYLHQDGNPIVSAGNYPANQDPAFASLGLDNGYLTSRPGTRGASFHSPSSDPAVVAYDEAHKDIVAAPGFFAFLAQRRVAPIDNLSNKITVPVLAVTGQQDAIFCFQPGGLDCTDTAAVLAREAPYYVRARSFKLALISQSGHDLTLHPSAGTSFSVINQWLKR